MARAERTVCHVRFPLSIEVSGYQMNKVNSSLAGFTEADGGTLNFRRRSCARVNILLLKSKFSNTSILYGFMVKYPDTCIIY